MMENSRAYFVGRAELLNWINSTLGLNLTKVEQTANGAVACQIIDAVHPGTINLSKVKFNASTEYDMMSNYKVLQSAFVKLEVDKAIDVNKLIKAKPLDNIEFMQWLKNYFDQQTGFQGVQNYDGPARRAGKGGSSQIKRQSIVSAGSGKTASNRLPAMRAHDSPLRATESSQGGQENEAMRNRVQSLEEELAKMQQKDTEVSQERDFYFSKLREIELLCQAKGVKDKWEVMQAVEDILYATTEDEGTQAREAAVQQLAGLHL